MYHKQGSINNWKKQEEKMETFQVANQVIDLQKSMFENTFRAVSMAQDHACEMSVNFFTQLPWMPQEVIKAMNESMKTFKEARDTFKNNVNEGFKQLSTMDVPKFAELFTRQVN